MDIFKILHYNMTDLKVIFTFLKNMSFLELSFYIGFISILFILIKRNKKKDDDK